MNLYLISDPAPKREGYLHAIVAAKNKASAQATHPRDDGTDPSSDEWVLGWCPVEKVEVDRIGITKPGTKRGVIYRFSTG